jgi:hypothetical protein
VSDPFGDGGVVFVFDIVEVVVAIFDGISAT